MHSLERALIYIGLGLACLTIAVQVSKAGDVYDWDTGDTWNTSGEPGSIQLLHNPRTGESFYGYIDETDTEPENGVWVTEPTTGETRIWRGEYKNR